MIDTPIFGMIIKTILLILLFVIYFSRDKFEVVIEKLFPKNQKRMIELFRKAIELCRIRYNNWFTSILLPIILIGSLGYYLMINNVPLSPEESGIINIFQSTVLTAIYEEILFRGIFLGLTVVYFTHVALKYLKWKDNTITKLAVSVWSLFLISIIFSLFHEFTVDLRYISGIIFGIVYLLDRKNVLPAMIAHFLNNAIVFV